MVWSASYVLLLFFVSTPPKADSLWLPGILSFHVHAASSTGCNNFGLEMKAAGPFKFFLPSLITDTQFHVLGSALPTRKLTGKDCIGKWGEKAITTPIIVID